MPWPDLAVLGENFNGSLRAQAAAGTPVDADSLPTYSIYEDGTNTALLTGSYSKLDDSGTTGLYQVEVAITTANGFERFKSYHVDSIAIISSTTVATSDSFIVFGSDDVFTSTSGALTSTANFKTYKGITSSADDSLIGALINRATSTIQRFVDRDLVETTYREIRDGTYKEIQPKNYPIISVQLYSTARVAGMSLTNTSSDAYHAYVQIDDDDMTLVVQGGDNAGTSTLTLSDSATLTALGAAIAALGTGWAGTVATNFALWSPTELLPVSGLNCLNLNVDLDIPDTPRSTFKIDYDAGIISNYDYGNWLTGGYGGYNYDSYYGGHNYFGDYYHIHRYHAPFQTVTIRYTAGYATTPGDLEQICIDLVALFYDDRKQRGGTFESEKLGDYSYRISADGNLAIPLGIQNRLLAWRKFTF